MSEKICDKTFSGAGGVGGVGVWFNGRSMSAGSCGASCNERDCKTTLKHLAHLSTF